jgi:hypothetical protein
MSFLLLLVSSLQQNCLEERGVEGKSGDWEQGEKWPKQCMHIKKNLSAFLVFVAISFITF